MIIATGSDPDPFTPAVRDVLCAADNIINNSHMIKNESNILMDDLNKQQILLRDSVNERIIQRIAQTATLTVCNVPYTIIHVHVNVCV